MITVTGGDALTAAEHAELYDRLLVPSFAADELDDRDAFLRGVAGGGSEVLAARGPQGRLVAAAVLETQPACGTRLLAYLAVDAAARGTGAGSALLARAIAGNRDALLLAEVEDPRFHPDRGFGDPYRRAAFYGRAGARVLDVPYYQPAVAPGQPPVPHVMLLVLADGPAPPTPATEVRTARIRCFVCSQTRSESVPFPGPDGGALSAALTGDRRLTLREVGRHLAGPTAGAGADH